MTKKTDTSPPVNRQLQAEASINVPINLDNWRKLPPEHAEDLLWYHQHLLSAHVSWKDIKNTLGYDRTTVFRVLKGTYEGSWENVIERIRDYRKSVKSIKRSDFAPNRVSRLISAAMDYVCISGGIVQIIGESGQGKTISAEDWTHRHNSGRTTMVECPPTGGHRNWLSVMCGRIGANKNQSLSQMERSILRSYNARRVLILDEAHRLLPNDRRSTPVTLEFIRSLHDQTGVPIGICVTQRFHQKLRQADYQFEQFLGRIDLTVQVPDQMDDRDYMPMLEQYIPEPGPKLQKLCGEIINTWDGRMRALNKLLKFASRIAAKANEEMTDQHVFRALEWRQKLERGEV